MKIGILIDRLNVGGVEKVALEEVKALRAAGEDAYLVVLRRKAVVENAFPDLQRGIPIIYLDDRLPGWLKISFKLRPFYFFSLFHLTYPLLIPWVVKKKEFNYIISHGTYTTFTAIAIKKIRHIRYSTFIWDPIGYILKRVYAGHLPRPVLKLALAVSHPLDRAVIKNADAVLVGGAAHDSYIDELVPGTKTIPISPSVHLSSLKGVLKQNYVVMVTAWKRGKHPEYLFELIKQLPNLQIKLVGRWLEDDYLAEYRDAVHKHGYEKNIEIIGGVSEADLIRYYSEAAVFLQTNDDRGFGMPALEAAAHGTPIIIPEGQGVCELLKDEADGFYTKELDTVAIVKHLRALQDDPSLAATMGRHARATVEREYSWSHHANTLLGVVKSHV